MTEKALKTFQNLSTPSSIEYHVLSLAGPVGAHRIIVLFAYSVQSGRVKFDGIDQCCPDFNGI